MNAANVRAGKLLTVAKYVSDDDLSSQLDGGTLVITISDPYSSGTIHLELNGLGLKKGEDYEETAPNQITFLSIAPEAGEVLVASYFKS